VFLAALDFWVVKNVSGRILVGLRWWNEINDEGNRCPFCGSLRLPDVFDLGGFLPKQKANPAN
jgi:hypothetical protein